MGYTLTIGQAEVSWDGEESRIGAKEMKLDNAPAFGEPTDYTNSRWPSYVNWDNCVRALRIEEIFFGEGVKFNGEVLPPLLAEHPGIVPITKGHYEWIKEKIETYRERHPDHVAKFDGNLRRAEWLLFWLKWAIENCSNPIFENS